MDFGWLSCVNNRFILGINKQIITILVSEADKEGDRTCVGVGNIWKISAPSSQFCCKSKTALQK